jgi:predicted dehydrogenase
MFRRALTRKEVRYRPKRQEKNVMPRKKVKWGVLSTASIAVRKVIPAMQNGEWCEVAAIASRDKRKAEEAARTLGIAKAYGSYEELLSDPEIEAIYNPLPNHLHMPWSIQAAEAEAKALLAARNRTGVKMGEAFRVKTHPQWLRTRELIRAGRIGELRLAAGDFCYLDRDVASVANIAEYGGGALMDIGRYLVTSSRFIFEEEPIRVMGLVERDPEMKIDRLTSGILEFPRGRAIFSCSTQLMYHQRMEFLGTKGRIELEIPFSAPNDRPSRIFIDDGRDLFGGGRTTEEFAACDQYAIQGELFSRAIRQGGEVPVTIEDAIKNMAVIEAVFRSAETGRWENP